MTIAKIASVTTMAITTPWLTLQTDDSLVHPKRTH